MKHSLLRLFIFTTGFCLLSMPVLADNNPAKNKSQCKQVSRADAISQARSRVNGKVVGIQLSSRGAKSVYQVRILVDKNRVKTVSIPACR